MREAKTESISERSAAQTYFNLGILHDAPSFEIGVNAGSRYGYSIRLIGEQLQLVKHFPSSREEAVVEERRVNPVITKVIAAPSWVIGVKRTYQVVEYDYDVMKEATKKWLWKII